MVAKVTITLAQAENFRGNLGAAVAHLTRSQELIDPQKSPSLFVNCQHDLAYLLTEAGHYEEAELRLTLARRLYEELGDAINLLSLRWLEARISRGQGQFEAAREVFEQIAEGFQEIGLQGQLGFLKLDHACLECEQGRLDEVLKLASEAYRIFSENGVPPQGSAALTIFVKAAKAKSATVDLIQSIAQYLSAPSTSMQEPFEFVPPTPENPVS